MTMQPYKPTTSVQTFEDQASIAATTSGVAGTINVPLGARLKGLDIAFTGAAGAIPVLISLSWPGSPQPLNFTPSIASVFATPGAAIAILRAIAIPLDVTVDKATIVTVTVTSTGNVTTIVGLRWI
jgi:hypothetical protein